MDRLSRFSTATPGERGRDVMNAALMRMMGARLGLSEAQVAALQNGDLQSVMAEQLDHVPEAKAMLQAMQATKTSEPRGEDARATGIQLQEALLSAHQVVAYLASVLGACTCFGQAGDCPTCAGRGAPGWQASSHPQEFFEWTTPTLARLGFQVVRQPRP
jgi:hypothetical protein